MLSSSTVIPAETLVRYYAWTEAGYDYFRNHGILALMATGASLDDIPSNVITAPTVSAGTSVLLPGLCATNNRIDPGRANVRGFVGGFDICRNPDTKEENCGVVYQLNASGGARGTQCH